MLPEAGAFELIFLAAVALIVVGPKDLPVLLRRIGQFTAKMRGLAAEFRSSFDEMARQSELDELRKEVDALRSGSFASAHTPDLKSHVDEINQHLSTPYWEQTPIYGSEPGVLPAQDLAGEGDEVSALPPPAPDVKPRAPSKPRAARKAAAPDSPSDVAAFSQGLQATPAALGEPVKTPRKRAAPKAAAPSSTLQSPASPEVA
ncbi:hypothetical protein BH09PSE2_BH09PSE2_09890 [soil metagenome]